MKRERACAPDKGELGRPAERVYTVTPTLQPDLGNASVGIYLLHISLPLPAGSGFFRIQVS